VSAGQPRPTTQSNPPAPKADVDALIDRLSARTAKVGVIGLGYVGLPLSREFCRAGFPVTGLDIDPDKIALLRAGKSYIKHVPDELVAKLVAEERLYPTADFDRIADLDAVCICVPTPLTRNREPDMAYIERTAEAIARRLRPGMLVVLESTTYPGTTREVVKPILERGGLTAGADFLLAFSPERENPGSTTHTTKTIPKVVGGIDRDSLRAAVALYSAAVDKVVPVGSAEVAEACKILENIYRCVNIALVNELKMLFDRMGIDVWEVISAASTKPFGFQAFHPGPGLGGHCIPIDPFYLTWKAREYDMPTRFIELAGEINRLMPDFVIGKLMDALNDRGRALRGSRVLVLGLAYKKDVDDLRESPSVVLIEKLRAKGALVDYNDPHIPRTHKQREHDLRMASVPLSPEMLAGYDAVVVSTDHSAYDWEMIVAHSRLVIDTRNATSGVKAGRERVVKA
jgi:UDP-N-acetyl-D-glucosamine dehydrogenase